MKDFSCFLSLFSSVKHFELYESSLEGNWINQQYGILLTFTNEGEYMLYWDHDGTSENGVFTIEDKTLTLNSSVSYRIQALTAISLTLYDFRAQEHLAFSRYTKTYTKIDGQQLATQSGLTLNTGYVQTYIDFMAFIIDAPLSIVEQQALQDACIASFKEQPKRLIEEGLQLYQTMQNIYAVTDLGQLGFARLTLINDFYKNNVQLEASAIGKIFQNYCKVVAFDPINAIPLTKKDLQGIVDYIEFLDTNFGEQTTATISAKQQLSQAITANFTQFSLEQKQSAAMGSLLYSTIQNSWNKLSSLAQVKLKAAFNVQNNSQQGYWNQQTINYWDANNQIQPNPALEALKQKGLSGKLTTEELTTYQGYLKRQQNYFNLMNNMHLQNHASMLELIESVGGSSNYWAIKTNL